MPKGVQNKKAKGKFVTSKRSAVPLAEDDPLATQEILTVGDLNLWSLSALKAFLTVRDKSLDGDHPTLVARAFIAWEEQATVNTDLEYKLRSNLADYKTKLRLKENEVLPDPFSLKDGWLGEGSKSQWPTLTITDIAEYLKERTTGELYTKLLNEYKLGKAYRYFKSRHVKEVHLHMIGDYTTTAFLSVKVSPTMRLSSPDYQVWAAVEKDSVDLPGGHIHSAYCTCPVGLHGTCNHIAGLLFRVEYAVRTGMTSSTSELCKWNVPANAKVCRDETRRLSEYKWKKDHYFTQDFDDDHQASTRQLAFDFSPLSKTQEIYARDEDRVVGDLAAIVREEVPNSCFIQLVDMKKTPQTTQVSVCPKALISFASEVDVSLGGSANHVNDLIQLSHLSKEDCETIEKATRNQAGCEEWKNQRIGRITASNMKRIFTRVATCLRTETDMTALLKTTMGYSTQSVSSYAIKHGVAMEPHAKRMYAKLMMRTHKGFSTRDSGLVLYQPKQYVAASPDLVSLCKCCGEGVVEIKCPWTCKNSIPTHENYSHLVEKDTGSTLSPSSQYMLQIQGQMACTGTTHCDFFVYTSHGHHLERIDFDKDMWDSMLGRFEYYWSTYVAPEILSGSLLVSQREEVNEFDHAYPSKKGNQHTECSTNIAAGPSSSKGVLTSPSLPIVYLCGICGLRL